MAETALTCGGSVGRTSVMDGVEAAEANAGLVWDRYLPMWRQQGDAFTRKIRDENGKLVPLKKPLKEFVEARRNAEKSLLPWLREHTARQRRALDHLAGQSNRVLRTIEVRTVARFATGLGADHPTENGFSFDPASGLPFLPGSALKGLCRRAALLEGRDAGTCTRWFGPERITAGSGGRQGEVTFFDAFPVQWPRLAVDIVNCHHPEYYRTQTDQKVRNRKPPTETEDPVPVYFLTVDRGAVFSVPLLAPAADADVVAEVMLSGLRWLGLGAKTAVGYGLMEGTVGE